MAIARTKEGLRAPLFFCVLALACGSHAQAQSVELAELERCARIHSAEEKLACFEVIAAGSQVAVEVAPEPAPALSREAVAAPVSEVPEAPARLANATQESAAGQEVASPSTAQSPAIQAAAEEPEPPPSVADTAPPVHEDDSFGREYLESVSESRSKEMSATVVDVTKTYYGELVFHLDNDQVWAQIEKRYYPYPKNQQFDVVISIGVLNEYQLQVGGTGRKVAVKRVK